MAIDLMGSRKGKGSQLMSPVGKGKRGKSSAAKMLTKRKVRGKR